MYNVLKASLKDARRVLLILVVASLVPSIVFLSPTASTLPSAYAAGVLSGISVMPSDQTVKQASYFTVQFTTATTGIIHTIKVTYPTGFVMGGTKLIEVSGIGSGSLTVGGQTLTYTVGTPVSVPAGTKIKLMFGNIINGATTSNTVAIQTNNASPIDSGTGSFTLTQITNSMIAASAVSNSKLATNSVSSSKITDGQVALVDLAANSVDSSKIVDGSVALVDLAANSVDSGKIVDGTIMGADINTAFMIRKTITDSVAGNAVGWNPDGTQTYFSISESAVDPSTSIPITSFTNNNIIQCDAQFMIPGLFIIQCNVAPQDGSNLHYIIINEPNSATLGPPITPTSAPQQQK